MSSKKPGSKKSAKRPGRSSSRKKRQAVSQNLPATKRDAVRPIVLLAGSGKLFPEWLAIFDHSPYTVVIYIPTGTSPGIDLPEGTKTVSRPDPRASVIIDCTLGEKQTKKSTLEILDSSYGPETLILTNSLALSATEQASWIAGKHRLLGVGLLPGFLERSLLEVAPTAWTPKQTVETALRFFGSLGKNIEIVQDRVGMVAARIICQLINEAAFALQDEIADPEDIDTSMKLGVSYPMGPFEWAERLGIENVVTLLQALHEEYQEERYRVSPLLRSMAIGGTWWKKGEASNQNKALS